MQGRIILTLMALNSYTGVVDHLSEF
jgi:hypothetical protein